jgi:hypothetical protein
MQMLDADPTYRAALELRHQRSQDISSMLLLWFGKRYWVDLTEGEKAVALNTMKLAPTLLFQDGQRGI